MSTPLAYIVSCFTLFISCFFKAIYFKACQLHFLYFQNFVFKPYNLRRERQKALENVEKTKDQVHYSGAMLTALNVLLQVCLGHFLLET